jgi:hypothetical protein
MIRPPGDHYALFAEPAVEHLAASLAREISVPVARLS